MLLQRAWPFFLASLSYIAPAQSQPFGKEVWTEEVRPSEQVGAQELVLRSFVIDGPVEGEQEHLIASVKLPPPAAIVHVALKVTDHSDKGDVLQAAIQCAAPGICERSWTANKIHGLGLTASDLWLTAVHGDTTATDGVLVPACFCKDSSLNARMPVVFTFTPSRALNIRYSIYNDKGELLDSRLINSQPAGLPVKIRVTPSGDIQSRLKMVVNHIAATGGDVERYSDTFYFYQM